MRVLSVWIADEFRKGQAAARQFKAMDKNKDGKLSREEWYEKYGTYEGFDEYDLNGDGFIDEVSQPLSKLAN